MLLSGRRFNSWHFRRARTYFLRAKILGFPPVNVCGFYKEIFVGTYCWSKYKGVERVSKIFEVNAVFYEVSVLNVVKMWMKCAEMKNLKGF